VTNPLEDATKALREQYDGKPQGNEQFTRTRVMAELREKQRRARARGPFVIPIIALLLGSAAWAASSGRLVAAIEKASAVVAAVREGGDSAKGRSKTGASRVGNAVSRTDPGPPAEPAVASSPNGTEPEPSAASDVPVTTASSAASDVPVAPLGASATPADVRGTAPDAPRASARAHGNADAPVDDAATARELELYEAAHRAHFVEKDANSALVAWTRYLAEMKTGRFRLEARYNHALCLLRLGRTAEASAELSGFASGKYGTYRQVEARRLLEGLGGSGSRTDAGQ
jgi:hypothetical protein